jgi:hypothetical protein
VFVEEDPAGWNKPRHEQASFPKLLDARLDNGQVRDAPKSRRTDKRRKIQPAVFLLQNLIQESRSTGSLA